MAFAPGYKARILLGDFSLSAKLNQVSLPTTVDMLDVTTFADDGVKRFIPGLSGSTASMSGFADADGVAEVAAWTTATPLTYAPFGLSRGSAVELVSTLRAQFQLGSPVAGVNGFSLSATTDGHTDLGVSLHDLTAVTGDENGTSHDGTAATTNGGVAQLHVSAFSGFSGVVVTIEDSANDADFATIATFTTVAGTTSERVAIAGTIRRYTRYVVDVTGSGSVTFQASIARR